jgi:hypothetical protein
MKMRFKSEARTAERRGHSHHPGRPVFSPRLGAGFLPGSGRRGIDFPKESQPFPRHPVPFRERLAGLVEGGVLSCQQIEVPVVAKVHEGSAEADRLRFVQLRPGGKVLEAVLAGVAIQVLFAGAGDEQVGVAVVVVVGGNWVDALVGGVEKRASPFGPLKALGNLAR